MSGTKSGKQRSSAVRTSVGIYGLAIIFTVVGFLVAYQFVEPAPPRTLRVATGSESGAYHRAAAEYRELLAQNGVTLELVPTSGTVENLRLLLERSEDGPRVAFAQSGVRLEIASGEESEERGDDPGVEVDEERQKEKAEEHGLLSLASIFYEPLWLVAELDRVEEQVRVVAVPLSRAHDLYDLRLHIAHLRATLKRTTESG